MDKRKILILGIFFLIFVGFFVSATEVEDYISSFVEREGIQKETIKNISEVNKSKFPKQILISNIEENNVGIYEVKYSEGGIDKDLFVLSYGTSKVEEPKNEFEVQNVEYLDFQGQEGFIGEYLMMDEGSIVGLSSVGDFSREGEIKIEVFKNGESIGLLNEIYSEGNNYDYELQSENINLFYPGDVISVKIDYINLNLEEVNSIVKIKIY